MRSTGARGLGLEHCWLDARSPTCASPQNLTCCHHAQITTKFHLAAQTTYTYTCKRTHKPNAQAHQTNIISTRLNGQLPLHHLLANADPTSAEAKRTGAGVSRYIDYILAHQQPDGWLGTNATDPISHAPPLDVRLWARYYLLYTLALRAESTTNATLRAQSIDAMLRHTHAAATRMGTQNWYNSGNAWGTFRVQEYLNVLQWLIEHAPVAEHPFLSAHAANVTRRAVFADWETWFERWTNAHCNGTALPHPAPGQPAWPHCGMMTHGANTAQAIKSAAILWRFGGCLVWRNSVRRAWRPGTAWPRGCSVLRGRKPVCTPRCAVG